MKGFMTSSFLGVENPVLKGKFAYENFVWAKCGFIF